MAAISIDADALFRAVVATDYKLLVHCLDLRTGEVLAKTLPPGEVQPPPPGPSVPPLPLLGGDLTRRKGEAPFGPPPAELPKKPDLFKDESARKPAFDGDFWKRPEKAKLNPFGGDGPKRESGAKKLAELFAEPPASVKPRDPFAPAPAPASAAPTPAPPPEALARSEAGEPLRRIPPAVVSLQLEWMRLFAKEAGDPAIRQELQNALSAGKPMPAFERVLRKYQRLNVQWQRQYRRQALHYASAWLDSLSIAWELVEP